MLRNRSISASRPNVCPVVLTEMPDGLSRRSKSALVKKNALLWTIRPPTLPPICCCLKPFATGVRLVPSPTRSWFRPK